MAYNKTDWKNRAVEKPRTFQLQDNGDGTFTLIPAEGTIYEAGTPVNAVNMNKVEQGIKDTETLANTKLPKDGSEPMTGYLKVPGIDSTVLNTTRKQLINSNSAGEIFVGNDSAKLTLESSVNPTLLRAGQSFQMWHAGNDGAGSGMDTDLFHGKAPNNYASAQNIAGGIDLNIVTDSGFYRIQAGNINAPSSVDYGQLIVSRGNNNGDTILQIITGFNGGAMYYRSGNPPNVGGNGVWSPWRRLWNDADIRINGGVLEFNDGGTWKAAGGVKSVQRGNASVGNNSFTDVGISAVNTSKAYLIINFSRSDPNGSYLNAELLNSTTVRISAGNAGSGGNVSWQVIESW